MKTEGDLAKIEENGDNPEEGYVKYYPVSTCKIPNKALPSPVIRLLKMILCTYKRDVWDSPPQSNGFLQVCKLPFQKKKYKIYCSLPLYIRSF